MGGRNCCAAGHQEEQERRNSCLWCGKNCCACCCRGHDMQKMMNFSLKHQATRPEELELKKRLRTLYNEWSRADSGEMLAYDVGTPENEQFTVGKEKYDKYEVKNKIEK